MAARTFARLASAGQGRRLFLLSWVAYAAAYVGRYNYSAVMSAITAEGTLTLSAAGAVSTGYFVCYAAELGMVLMRRRLTLMSRSLCITPMTNAMIPCVK